MRLLFTIALAFLLLCSRPSQAASAETDIQSILNRQVEAWNRGDIRAFVSAYAEDCTFIGKTVLVGRAAVLARYQRTYSSREAMGKLTFGRLSIRLLGNNAATAVGEWHLERTSAGGSPVGGFFSLVWQFRQGTWQIVLDHTS